MKQSKEYSQIMVWSTQYINNPELREIEDQKLDVVQIDPVPGDHDHFLFEVMEYAK